jgi:hypothetical protein
MGEQEEQKATLDFQRRFRLTQNPAIMCMPRIRNAPSQSRNRAKEPFRSARSGEGGAGGSGKLVGDQADFFSLLTGGGSFIPFQPYDPLCFLSSCFCVSF